MRHRDGHDLRILAGAPVAQHAGPVEVDGAQASNRKASAQVTQSTSPPAGVGLNSITAPGIEAKGRHLLADPRGVVIAYSSTSRAGCYPARAGGLWLWRTLVRSGFQAVVVPSGFRTRVQPHWWITTQYRCLSSANRRELAAAGA